MWVLLSPTLVSLPSAYVFYGVVVAMILGGAAAAVSFRYRTEVDAVPLGLVSAAALGLAAVATVPLMVLLGVATNYSSAPAVLLLDVATAAAASSAAVAWSFERRTRHQRRSVATADPA